MQSEASALINVKSWNLAFGGPGLPNEPRRTALPDYLRASNADVLLLQETQPQLPGPGWSSVASPGGGQKGACVSIAVRAEFGTLSPVDVDVPKDRQHCLLTADLIYPGGTLRLVSLYVPWRDSSAKWLQDLLDQPALQVPGVIGADLNSPIGPKPAPHPMIDIATDRGWIWASMPLLSAGPTMKQSQIDHLLVRDLTVHDWGVDVEGLRAGLSDHAALHICVEAS